MADLDLGTDLDVRDDMDDNKGLVFDLDCLAQDVLLRLDQPRGLADGTEEGAAWGFDLKSRLNSQLTSRSLLELIVEVEAQIEQDDRVDRCDCSSSYWVDAESALYLIMTITTTGGPYVMTFFCTSETVQYLLV
jgi:hypothetical protein